MKVLLGKKIEMTQIFREDGSVVPVTMVQAGPCTITAVKTQPNGSKAVVLGYGTSKSVNKPQRDDWKDLGAFSDLLEVPVADDSTLERGAKLDVTVFEEGDQISVTGTSKGKGFQGVVRRHGFAGSPATHGHKDQLRMPGSIGAGGPQRVFKGKKMPGRMGGDTITVQNLEIIQVDEANQLIAVKGAIPGSRGSVVAIKGGKGTIWHN